MIAYSTPNRQRRRRGTLPAVATLALITCLASASAQPQQAPNGNYYEIVIVPQGIGWQAAKTAAEQRTYLGRTAHLATLNTAEEDVFVEYLRQQLPSPYTDYGQLWAGGYQLADQPSPRDGWFWVNDEGPIPGVNGGATYAGWFSGEPNDCCDALNREDNQENYLTIGLFIGLGWNDSTDAYYPLFGYVVEYDRLVVAIDIKPGSATNPINLDAPGKVPVAILSTATFDAATVNRTSLTFGRNGLEAAVLSTTLSDVNGDKRKDLVCQFNVLDAGFICGDTTGILRGRTTDGSSIFGTDSLQTPLCPPFGLSIVALQDKNHVTDLQLKVSAVLPGYTPPTVAQNTVLKSYDLTSNLRWNKTLQNTALIPIDAVSSAATLQYTDMEHYQQVNARMSVPGTKPGSSFVLRDEAVVLRRPDLAVARVVVRSSDFARQVINIPAHLRELNGDLGATANVFLMEGDTVLDTALDVNVPAASSVTVVFSAVFAEPGPHTFRVVIGDVNPGDYDSSNNEGTASIEIVELAPQTVTAYLQYSSHALDYVSEESSPYWISRYSENWKDEYFNQQIFVPTALNFPIDSVRFDATVDGRPLIQLDAASIPLDGTVDWDYYVSDYGYQDLGNGWFVAVESSRYTSGDSSTRVEVNHFASDYVVFSSYHDLIYGTIDEWGSDDHFGTMLNPTNRIDTRFVVLDDNGAYGGNASMSSLTTYPWWGNGSWDFINDYGDYQVHYKGHYLGIDVFGTSGGETTW